MLHPCLLLLLQYDQELLLHHLCMCHHKHMYMLCNLLLYMWELSLLRYGYDQELQRVQYHTLYMSELLYMLLLHLLYDQEPQPHHLCMCRHKHMCMLCSLPLYMWEQLLHYYNHVLLQELLLFQQFHHNLYIQLLLNQLLYM